MKRCKNYFSFFGILQSTVISKLNSVYSQVEAGLVNIVNINKKQLDINLKPIKINLTKNN